ncbi:MAG: NADH-quinone oxidoreductase subunit NuoF [Gammaproteobacteria bacterium]|jgi:NADH-quinone oxidoreductase subunit F
MDKPLTQNIVPGSPPPDITAYEKAGGYQALRKALKTMTPDEVIEEVKSANLRGRGGAGFPAGIKWSSIPQGGDAPHPKYLVINADEMEPGTFKDRLLLEGDPHQLLEGMIVAAYAIQADVSYMFLREEYKRAARYFQRAVDEAYQRGYLGKNILGSGYNLELHLHTSAGRYMCGEARALLNALEGKRAVPRAKGVRATTSGLWGKPTVVNNVETICNVPHIINNGAGWFLDISNSTEGKYGKDGGTKIYGVSGKVNKPGAWELPMGTPIHEILEDYAGGMKNGYQYRAVLPGGASTEFILAENFDVPMDFNAVQSVHSRLGTGTMIVLDDHTCPVGMLHNLEHFFAQESCGWCTPCREGLPWTAEALRAIENGEGQPGDLEQLNINAKYMNLGFTFCALAPGAVEPLASGLCYFQEDFQRHIKEQRCPWD